MAYGMRVWDASGNLRMDENSFTVRIVLSVVVNNSGWTIVNSQGAGYQDFSCPGVTPSNASATCLPVANYTSNETQFETEVRTDVVRVYNYNRGYAGFTNPATTASMRLIVVRMS